MHDEAALVVAVQKEKSVAGVVRALGRSIGAATYALVRREVARMGLDTSHWRLHSNGRPLMDVPLAELLVENGTHNRALLKRRLVSEGFFPYACAECGLSEWRGKRLALQLEHKNGKSRDNRLENLCLLCPNCHSQTPTFCGRNQPEWRKAKPKTCGCGKVIDKGSKSCVKCVVRVIPKPQSKIEWPPSSDLRARIAKSTQSAVARELGVAATTLMSHIERAERREAQSTKPLDLCEGVAPCTAAGYEAHTAP